MRDHPDGPDLLALLSRIEDCDPSISLPDDERYLKLMLAHAKAIAGRQEERGCASEARELQDLGSLLGSDGGDGESLADLNGRLAAAIRGGDFDPGTPGHDAAREHLWQTALERARESNPKALEGLE
jgi:hypothetical protein